ncbi:B-cell receptor CD22 isoform X1 [Sinocyclocheilus grahami]|uniref:B-cell receptor CD22 isoform X1 n=1 Tax=Sinocyclocheilus grahami TaxID=75366 RepID=UPI0007AD4690|nr:PREDICTED: B-cell receptor CD22-like isoform X1 [Sinocyclocheilus grahami]XP_016128357.1 PREDICTED: B-cell receptor CD22-like isoform X1 [Sinocyclocheilus grahami]XP_016128358.1 PREDICTED: B-cell receptor CD22-like isoform X1 [Sinocyclocheilus grahami]
MMVPEGIPLLLFVSLMLFFPAVLLEGSCISSNEDLIIVPEKTETTYEGSSVTIPCTYKNPKDNTNTLLWFKDQIYLKDMMFNGTIVYSNTKERPQSPGYSSRVEYITDKMLQDNQKDWIKCNLRITDLQKTDSGNYSFRFIGSDKRFMSKALSLKVKDNPCKVHIETSELKNPLNESEEFTLRCSTFGSCDFHPEWLVQTSGQKQEWMSSLTTDTIIETEEGKEGRKVTKLKLNVTWKDDNRILSCHPATSEDSCQIRNITLSVEHAPKETKATVSSENIKEGDSVTLSCTSTGRPDVSFSWFKKEKIEKYQQMSDLTLINVKQEDSGEYYCEAKNKHGAKESNIIKIDVKYGPQGVTVHPLVDINDLKEEDKLTLQCLVQRGNPAVYQFMWYKNSQAQHETSETFIISKVTADNRGSYHCQADNGIKTATSNNLIVSVKYSPRSIQIEGTTSVKVGTPLTLTCSADADPWPHTYKWKHTPRLFSVPLSMETGQLNIENVTIQHAGQYTCDVTNTIGTGSHSINVYVLYPPSNLSLIMKREVREFEVISIICTVQSVPVSHLTVTGPQDDLTYIQNNQRNSTASANKLTVYLNVTESDAGTYKCNAKSQEGKQEMKQELIVFHVPKNVTASVKGEQTFGSELTLTCEARANPALSSYEWKKCFNGQLKTIERKPEQRLHFLSLEISDSGQYACIAQNSIGKRESPLVEIKVKYVPNIKIVHNTTTLTQWNWEFPVYLTCSADAYPPATVYKWYREEDNTTALSDHQNFTVQPQNPGIYYCTAANAIGKSRSKNIMLFIGSNSLTVFYQIILPIILLLILIFVAIFLIRRTIIKARSDQQSGADNPLCFFPVFLSRSSTVTNLLLLGSRNNTQENLSVAGIPDSGYGRVNQSRLTPNSQDLTRAQDPNPRPKSNIHTVYAAIKLPQMKQRRQSPKQQKNGYMDNDATTSTLNYATLDFKGQNEPEKRVPEGSAVYTMVSKNKQTMNSQSENTDYENVSSACVPKLPFTNMDWESDTSEEDEVNYTTVACPAKSAVKEPKHKQKSCLSSSSSDDEDRTVYSAINT